MSMWPHSNISLHDCDSSELNECAVVYLFFVHADGKTTPKPLKNRHFFFGLFQIIEVETQIITRWDLQQSSSCRPINVNVCLFEWAANVIYKIWVIKKLPAWRKKKQLQKTEYINKYSSWAYGFDGIQTNNIPTKTNFNQTILIHYINIFPLLSVAHSI